MIRFINERYKSHLLDVSTEWSAPVRAVIAAGRDSCVPDRIPCDSELIPSGLGFDGRLDQDIDITVASSLHNQTPFPFTS